MSGPFGFLCITPGPGLFRVLPVHTPGGSPGACNGIYQMNFSAWAATGIDAALVTGAQVDTQIWYRDPASPGTANFTDALSFVFP